MDDATQLGELGRLLGRLLRRTRPPRLRSGYPGFEVEVETLRADPSQDESITVPQTVEHLEEIVRQLDERLIFMGHSFGDVLTQILLDHRFGAAGVAIDSVPAEGIKVVPPSQIRASFAVLKNPANRHRAVPLNDERPILEVRQSAWNMSSLRDQRLRIFADHVELVRPRVMGEARTTAITLSDIDYISVRDFLLVWSELLSVPKNGAPIRLRPIGQGEAQ